MSYIDANGIILDTIARLIIRTIVSVARRVRGQNRPTPTVRQSTQLVLAHLRPRPLDRTMNSSLKSQAQKTHDGSPLHRTLLLRTHFNSRALRDRRRIANAAVTRHPKNDSRARIRLATMQSDLVAMLERAPHLNRHLNQKAYLIQSHPSASLSNSYRYLTTIQVLFWTT